jgi:hypothetical protein
VVANHNLIEGRDGRLRKKKVIAYDLESIEALQEDRKDVWDRISKATFMTLDEQRTEAGLPALNIPGVSDVPSLIMQKPVLQVNTSIP